MVAIILCPAGIAHTFTATEALTQAADALGHMIHAETQGSAGAQNTLPADAIATVDLVLIVADTQVDLSRSVGKRVFRVGAKAAIHDGRALIRRAFDEASLEGTGTA